MATGPGMPAIDSTLSEIFGAGGRADDHIRYRHIHVSRQRQVLIPGCSSALWNGGNVKLLNRFCEWLLRFASSQRSIDRVAMWFGGSVSILAATFTIAVIVMLLSK